MKAHLRKWNALYIGVACGALANNLFVAMISAMVLSVVVGVTWACLEPKSEIEA